ncbi:hypothetical protein Hanom_Chr03g00207791 [Helianthus anomalus]
MIIQEDEGFNWNNYIKDERKEKWSLVAEIKRSWEEEEAHCYLNHVYDAYKEARRANRWCEAKDCYVDQKGNPTIDPDVVDFKALVAAIPTIGVWCRGLREIPRYREKVEEGINKVIYASLEKKKKIVEEIIDESEKMVKEVKKERVDDEKPEKHVDEVVAEKQQEVEENQKQMVKEAAMPNTEVKTQTESSEMLDKSDLKTDKQCKKSMEMCKVCTEKDNNLRSRDIEFTKIEKIFKEKCNEMLENGSFLKEKEK